jgi:hypothetical protein
MTNTKFVVKVNRGGTRAPEYVQRVDPTPIHMTTNRKLALMMGRFTAEDAVKSLQTPRCSPELVSGELVSKTERWCQQNRQEWRLGYRIRVNLVFSW